MSVLIKGGLIVTQDSARRVLRGDVLVDGERISAVGEAHADADQIIDARGMVVMPGLVNLHGHVSMSVMRAIADDMSFDSFLERTFAADADRGEDDVLRGARLGCAEMLLTGTTSFLDLYYSEEQVARACEELGIRGFLAWAVLDDDKSTQKGSPIDNCGRFMRDWKGHRLVRPLVGPQGVYACSEDTLLAARELARGAGTVCHYHLSETRGEVYGHLRKTGKRPVDWLDHIGFLDAGDIAAHSVWITRNEARTLCDRGVSVAHCPTSNMKLAVGGVCPVSEIAELGGTVGLGTDGSASNNSLDMFIEMKVCALIHKHNRWDPTAMSAQRVLDMATVDGARALGMEGEIGSIEPGKLADIVVVDAGRIGMVPTDPENVISNLVYSCSGQNVFCTMVSGEIVTYDGELTRMDIGPELRAP